MLSVFVNENNTDWDDISPVCFQHTDQVYLPIDLILPTSRSDRSKAQNYQQYVQWIRQALQSAHTLAHQHLDEAIVHQKRNYDLYAKSRQVYTPDSLVRYYYMPEKNKHTFAKPWLDPFNIRYTCGLQDQACRYP